MIVVGMMTNIEVHRKSGSIYQLDQTLIQGDPVEALALSEDEKELLAGTTSLSIYRNGGTTFALSQSIAIGFSC